jgi:hypothetical protein
MAMLIAALGLGGVLAGTVLAGSGRVPAARTVRTVP